MHDGVQNRPLWKWVEKNQINKLTLKWWKINSRLEIEIRTKEEWF